MSEFLEQLRSAALLDDGYGYGKTFGEAADEVERLSAKLEAKDAIIAELVAMLQKLAPHKEAALAFEIHNLISKAKA